MALAPAFLLATGCATEKETPANEAEKRYFDAWMQKYHPDAVATEHWVYIIDDIPATGTSTEAADKDYVFVTYTEKDLSGNISGTNDIEIAKKLNQYNETYYYGPAIWNRSSIMSGVMYAIEGMNIGDFRSVIIPGWLMSYSRYSSEKDYLATNTLLEARSDAKSPFDVGGVDMRYLRAALDAIEEAYGSLEGYLTEALGLDGEARAELRARFTA